MSVNIATNLVIIAALVALYTKLAPNNPAVEAQRATNATFFRTSQELTPTEGKTIIIVEQQEIAIPLGMKAVLLSLPTITCGESRVKSVKSHQ